MKARNAARGFTLIELMIVVAIIGILSSVAIPVMQQLTLRSKSAERLEIMLRIKKGVADYYLQKGNTFLADNTTQLEGTPQPAAPPGPMKRIANFKDQTDGWFQIFRWSEEIMGTLYYQYSFRTDDSVNPPTLTVWSVGDLDGDGIYNTWWTRFSRVNGAYIVVDPTVDEDHPEGTF